MAKRTTIEDALSRLHALRGCPRAPESRRQLVEALSNKVNLIAAKAASLIAEFGMADMSADMERAFARFMHDPAATDKGCAGKTALAKALYELGCDAPETFVRGVQHVQHEPAFGGPADTAAELRGLCALGLVRMGHPQALDHAADLLVDAEIQARILGVRAIAYAAHPLGLALLRLKALVGDREADVMAEVFPAMMKLDANRAMPFIARFLDRRDPAIAQAAAITLAESHSPAAFALLRAAYESRANPGLLLPIAMLRLGEAMEFLLTVAATADSAAAAGAVEALALYRQDESLRTRLAAAIKARRDPATGRALEAWDRQPAATPPGSSRC